MSMYMNKYKKQENVNQQETLDSKHDTMLSMIQEDELKLPKLEEELKELKKEYKHSNDSTIYFQIKTLKNQIKNIKKMKKEYYLKNSKYIFHYFEKKQNIESGNNKRKILNDFFNISNTKQCDEDSKHKYNTQKYLMNINDYIITNKDFCQIQYTCNSCHIGELIHFDNDGIFICNHCSMIHKHLVENERPSYRDPPKEVCFYAYKRINHFREIIAQFQAKESTQIPKKVIDDFKSQIKKERLDIHTQLTNKKAKEILKKLNYSKYYEHVPFIKDKIGIKPPVMDQYLEDTLCNLFLEIQAPYAKYCPDYRVNFLNYYYTIYKLCELLNQKQFLEFFPKLKDPSKRIEQDEIWKKICNELNWKFIPTV